jgi:4-amino-4-deoxy-L-arabinose transferase-like glycosyltransferase
MKPVYQNRRGWRVRVAQAAIWLGAGFGLWLVFLAPPNPADQSSDQIVASVGAIFTGCAVLAFEIYLRLYVLRIEREGDVFLVTTLATLHHRHLRLDRDSLSLGETQREQAPAFLVPGYDNYWRGLKTKGHLLPFIIDTTAHDDR